MSKKQIKKIIFMGVGCALLLIVGTIYSLLYNDGRWVKNMDMSEYVFSYKDIPICLLYTSPSPRDRTRSRMPSSA